MTSKKRAARRGSSGITKQGSPYHAALARFHLGKVLAALGDAAAARARAAYAAFLRCWAEPDRPVLEVAAARRRLAPGGLT